MQERNQRTNSRILPKRRASRSPEIEGVKWLKAEIGPREVCFCCGCFFKMDEIIACLCIDDSDLVEENSDVEEKGG